MGATFKAPGAQIKGTAQQHAHETQRRGAVQNASASLLHTACAASLLSIT